MSLVIFSQDFTVRGFVFDKSTGEPMAYEKIKLIKNTDSSLVAGSLSDLDGFFNIAKIKKGKYIIKVDNVLYKKQLKNIEVTASKGILNVRFELEKLASIKEMDEIVLVQKRDRKKIKFLFLN